jgi:starvation-inducible DNA-binding protein
MIPLRRKEIWAPVCRAWRPRQLAVASCDWFRRTVVPHQCPENCPQDFHAASPVDSAWTATLESRTDSASNCSEPPWRTGLTIQSNFEGVNMLQHIEARAIAAVPGVDWDLAEGVAHRLNRDLATLTDLTAVYKQAHWNVLGSTFTELHRLFDELADETRAYVDLVAERAVASGGVAHGTLQAAVESTALGPFPVNERDERRLVQELSRRVERTVEELREAIAATAEEPVTQDLYVEIARAMEKQRWMLLAHLTGPQGAGGG